jgi:membrane-associated phospholipid phosphatase
MKYFLDIVQGVDLRTYHFLSRFAGNWFIDRFVYFQESEQILKGGLVLAAYWWLWFRGGSDREKRREAIIAIMFATVLAVVVTRILAAATPFRLRPIYVPNLEHHWSIPIDASFAQWNSFPSDTAAYFCALAFGLIVLLPRLKVPIVLYTAGWICFPRVYFGYHYVSDVVAGAVIGVAVVWAVLRAEWLQSAVVPRVVAFADLRPHVFYPAAFLIGFEMATVFWDIRMLELKLVHATRMLGHHALRAPSAATAADSLLAFTALLLVVAAAIVILHIRHSAHGREHVTPNSR